MSRLRLADSLMSLSFSGLNLLSFVSKGRLERIYALVIDLPLYDRPSDVPSHSEPSIRSPVERGRGCISR